MTLLASPSFSTLISFLPLIKLWSQSRTDRREEKSYLEKLCVEREERGGAEIDKTSTMKLRQFQEFVNKSKRQFFGTFSSSSSPSSSTAMKTCKRKMSSKLQSVSTCLPPTLSQMSTIMAITIEVDEWMSFTEEKRLSFLLPSFQLESADVRFEKQIQLKGVCHNSTSSPGIKGNCRRF